MPELPEVETIRLGLSKKIIGLKIKSIQILNQKSFQGNPKLAEGMTIKNIWRRAKVLGIELEDSKDSGRARLAEAPAKRARMTMLIHLKMSGQLILIKNSKLKIQNYKSKFKNNQARFIGGHPTQDMKGDMPIKSTRVIFEFSDGSKLFFNDQRKFGWIKLVESSKLKVESFLLKLGPEPLEKQFTWEVLKQNLLKHKGQAVKATILDQSVVSGIGNIYACEALFHANLDPRLKVSKMSDKQFKKLHLGIIRALKDGIKYGGSSRTHFVNEEGKKGYFLDSAYVYSREGKECKICKTIIKKIRLGGRGTTFCPNCQK